MAGSLLVAVQGSVLRVNSSEEKSVLPWKAHGKPGWLSLGGWLVHIQPLALNWTQKERSRVHTPGQALKHRVIQYNQRTEGCWVDKSHAFLIEIWVRLCGGAEEQVLIKGNCISGGAETYKVKGAFGSQQDHQIKAEGAGSRQGGGSFQREATLPLLGHLAMSGVTFGCHN